MGIRIFCAIGLTLSISSAHAAIDQTNAEKITQTIHALFSSDLKEQRIKLSFLFKMNDKIGVHRASIGTWEIGKFRRITVSGPELLRPETTLDSFTGDMCHELGHILGGSPASPYGIQPSVEGQADYWAGTVCLPRFFRNSPDTGLINPNENPAAKAVCESKTDSLENKICIRSVLAAETLTRNFYTRIQQTIAEAPAELKPLEANKYIMGFEFEKYPSLSSNDPSEVETTSILHPHNQCRLDTIVAGVLQKPRPRCWFKDEKVTFPSPRTIITN